MQNDENRFRVAWEPLRLALWFGLLAGAARSLHYVAMRLLADQLLLTGDEVIYMAPLGHLTFFVVVALPLSAFSLLTQRRISSRVLTGLFATLALFSFLLLFPRIHHLASLALAVGGGIQISRRMSGMSANGRVVLNRLSAGILTATLVAAVAIPAAQRQNEARTIRSLPRAASDAPNILLVILDATRAQNMSVYGYPRRTTPNIARLGEQGVVFERAIATTSWTLPSVASMITGYYPTSLSADWLTPLDERYPVLAERLLARGYLTGAFSANLNYVTRETGLARGFLRFMDVRITASEMLLTVSLVQSDLVRNARLAMRKRDVMGLLGALARFHWARSSSTPTHLPKSADLVVRQFLDWQVSAQGRPWFAMLQMIDAHAPYKAKAPFDTLFRASGVTAAYDGAIATIDRELGALWTELRRRGAMERTIVVIAADHGELFGEFGLWEHGNSLFMPVVHVPLIIRAPGRVPPGIRVRHPVSLRDLGATMLDLVDRGSSDEPELGGHSLRSTWDSTSRDPRSAAVSALTVLARRRIGEPMQWHQTSLLNDSLHYIRNDKGNELLFDLRVDSAERETLTKSPAGRARADIMRLQLGSALQPER